MPHQPTLAGMIMHETLFLNAFAGWNSNELV